MHAREGRRPASRRGDAPLAITSASKGMRAAPASDAAAGEVEGRSGHAELPVGVELRVALGLAQRRARRVPLARQHLLRERRAVVGQLALGAEHRRCARRSRSGAAPPRCGARRAPRRRRPPAAGRAHVRTISAPSLPQPLVDALVAAVDLVGVHDHRAAPAQSAAASSAMPARMSGEESVSPWSSRGPGHDGAVRDRRARRARPSRSGGPRRTAGSRTSSRGSARCRGPAWRARARSSVRSLGKPGPGRVVDLRDGAVEIVLHHELLLRRAP